MYNVHSYNYARQARFYVKFKHTTNFYISLFFARIQSISSGTKDWISSHQSQKVSRYYYEGKDFVVTGNRKVAH